MTMFFGFMGLFILAALGPLLLLLWCAARGAAGPWGAGGRARGRLQALGAHTPASAPWRCAWRRRAVQLRPRRGTASPDGSLRACRTRRRCMPRAGWWACRWAP